MTTYWEIATYGNPLGGLRKFLWKVWSVFHLDGMLVPLMKAGNGDVRPAVIENPKKLERVNPFIPLMRTNVASLVPDLVRLNPGKRYGMIMRPCEMRALIEVGKHDSFSLSQVLTICIDCLGTFPEVDFQWRLARKGSPDAMTGEAIQFARLGGVLAYRQRSACQTCISTAARGADLNIKVIGLQPRRMLLINVKEELLESHPEFEGITDGQADPDVTADQRQRMAHLEERLGRTYQREVQGLPSGLPRDVEGVRLLLEGCYDCQACLESCPICGVDFPTASSEGCYATRDITRWLISCSGCGMCEEACPNCLPLSTVYRGVRDVLAALYDYTPGISSAEPLPVV